MDNMGNLPIYPLGEGGKKSWQLARTAVMIEVVGMMLIMRTNNKRLGQEEQYLPTPPSLPIWSHCVQHTALHYWFGLHHTAAVYSM